MYKEKLIKIVQLRRGEKVSTAAIKKIIGDTDDAVEAITRFKAYHDAKGNFIESWRKKDHVGITLNCGDNCTMFYFEVQRPAPIKVENVYRSRKIGYVLGKSIEN